MSEPTYRIDLIHRPHETLTNLEGEQYAWAAHVVRLSDDMPMQVLLGTDPRDAAEKARQWVIRQNGPRETRQPIYLTETGVVTGPPRTPGHSEKVA